MVQDDRRPVRSGQLTGVPLPEVLEHDPGVAIQQTTGGLLMQRPRQAQGDREVNQQTRERLGRENRGFTARPWLAVNGAEDELRLRLRGVRNKSATSQIPQP